MKSCCLQAVSQFDSSFETLTSPVADWTARLTAGLTRSVQASDQTLGHLEEEILQQTRGLERQLLEEAAQRKADQTLPRWIGKPVAKASGPNGSAKNWMNRCARPKARNKSCPRRKALSL